MTTIIAKVDKFFQQERSGDVSTAHWRGEIIILIHFHFRFNFLDPPRDTNSVLEYLDILEDFDQNVLSERELHGTVNDAYPMSSM